MENILHSFLYTTTLQFYGVTNHVIKAYQDINNFTGNLKYLRENLDNEFNDIFRESKTLAKILGITPSIPRIVCMNTWILAQQLELFYWIILQDGIEIQSFQRDDVETVFSNIKYYNKKITRCRW